jgi:hypothetical protein
MLLAGSLWIQGELDLKFLAAETNQGRMQLCSYQKI